MCGKVERLQQLSANLQAQHSAASTLSTAGGAATYGRGFPNLYYSKEQCFAVNNIDYVLQVSCYNVSIQLSSRVFNMIFCGESWP
jgi:hypothetical protein